MTYLGKYPRFRLKCVNLETTKSTIMYMKGFTKNSCVRFNNITNDKSLVFALCEKLRENRVHIQQGKIYTTWDDEKELSSEYLGYLVEKVIYNSHPSTRDVNADDLVDNFYDWFCYELNSRECLVEMLGGEI